MKRIILIICVISLIPARNYGQSNIEIGFLPSLNINKSLQRDWSLIFKAESRQSLKKGDFDYDYLLTDISLAGSKKAGINTSVAAGYMVRIVDNKIRNRTFQQVTFVERYPRLRISHRLLSDQTFEKDQNTEFRLRYRISSEIPFQGQTPDPKEFFVKLNNEYLNSIQGKIYDLELRGAGFIGYVISTVSKLEIGFDYRIDSFINGNTRNRLWLGLNFYTSI